MSFQTLCTILQIFWIYFRTYRIYTTIQFYLQKIIKLINLTDSKDFYSAFVSILKLGSFSFHCNLIEKFRTDCPFFPQKQKFATTWGWINDEILLIFSWTILLSLTNPIHTVSNISVWFLSTLYRSTLKLVPLDSVMKWHELYSPWIVYSIGELNGLSSLIVL